MTPETAISETPGNTPVMNVPADYCPEGSGGWFILPEGRDAGKKMFFADIRSGKAAPEETIVFVHGNPECAYVYRDVIRQVASESRKPCRMVVMDHIGFGLSDQATYEAVDMDHAENLIQLVRYLDLRNVTLVVHDWGGPIGIGAFLKDPGRVKNLVITNTTVFPIPEEGSTFRNYPMRYLPWSRLPYVIPKSLWGYLAAYIVELEPSGAARILTGACLHTALSLLGIKKLSAAQTVYCEQMRSRANVKASKRFVLHTPCWGRGMTFRDPVIGRRDTRPFYEFIHEAITPAWGPEGQHIGVRAVLGRWDPLGKDAVIAQWKAHLPQIENHIRILEDVGHFVEEFAPRAVAAAVLELTARDPG